MARSATFFNQVGDVTLLGMLLERLVKVTEDKIDIEELLEKAEIRFLEIVGYEASYSEERLKHVIANSELDAPTVALIAQCFALHSQGGPIYKCLDAYALSLNTVDKDSVNLLFWL